MVMAAVAKAKAEKVEKVETVAAAVETAVGGAEVAREESVAELAVAQLVAAYFRATADAQEAHRCGLL